MKFTVTLTTRAFGAVLSAAALAAIACADGSPLPTSPSATAVTAVASESADGATFGTTAAREGELAILKECSQFSGEDGTFCTITSSSLAAIEAGSRVVYETVSGFGDLDTDVILDPPGPGNNVAFGHCTLNATVSRCEFSGGTGKFKHFHAAVEVSYLGGVDYGWNGTYSFSPKD